jgi:DNA (cytosine-5)-methyltransferase 1
MNVLCFNRKKTVRTNYNDKSIEEVRQENMRSIELFAGIGGIALAAEWAGIETAAFCEREPFCQKVLNKHWPDVPIFDDVRTLNKQALEERGIDVGTIELISGGFPCQPFSVAGRKKGREDDRDLWPEMFRIIRELKPRWIVGENVANFVNMELERTCTDLESEGYETQTFIIPACGVNAKHQRYRTFVVAHSNSIEQRTRNGLQQPKGDTTGECVSNSGSLELSETMADTDGERLERGEDPRETSGERAKWNQQFAGCDKTGATWAIEPNVGRVANGVSNRVDRLRSLGNAVVPQQIYPIFKNIMEIERMKNR